MKKLIAVVLIAMPALLLRAQSGSPPAELSAALRPALDRIGRAHGRNLTAVFGNFTYGDSGLAGPFSRFLQEQLAQALTESPYFDLVVLNALDNLDPAFLKAFGGVFKPEQADSLIRGTYSEESGRVAVDLEVISLTDGTLIGKTKVAFDKALLPAQAALKPQNYGRAAAAGRLLGGLLPAGPAGFSVRVATNRGNGGVYRDGEELTISFFADRDAYLKLYHIDVNGRVKLIFPNPFHSDNRIRAGRLTVIPDESYPFRFVLGPPYGTEYIKAIASTEPFSEVEGAFQELGPAGRELLTRGLEARREGGLVAEALLSYTIVER